jgi:hypothetical protein
VDHGDNSEDNMSVVIVVVSGEGNAMVLLYFVVAKKTLLNFVQAVEHVVDDDVVAILTWIPLIWNPVA